MMLKMNPTKSQTKCSLYVHGNRNYPRLPNSVCCICSCNQLSLKTNNRWKSNRPQQRNPESYHVRNVHNTRGDHWAQLYCSQLGSLPYVAWKLNSQIVACSESTQHDAACGKPCILRLQHQDLVIQSLHLLLQRVALSDNLWVCSFTSSDLLTQPPMTTNPQHSGKATNLNSFRCALVWLAKGAWREVQWVVSMAPRYSSLVRDAQVDHKFSPNPKCIHRYELRATRR